MFAFFQSKVGLRLAGFGVVAVILGLFGLTAAFYNHAFSNPLTVTLRTNRAGLLLDTGNVVKMRGIEVGKVGAVHVEPDGGVSITLELDRAEVGMIPADVQATIDASTIFGAKYVTLTAPGNLNARPITAGAVITNGNVTPEVDTIFDQLDKVLTSVNVVDLNVTLTSLAGAVQGRGAEIADLAAKADAYLTRLEPLLPTMRADLYQLALAGRLGVKIAPAFLSLLRNASVTATTVTAYQQQLARLLVDANLLGKDGVALLGANGKQLEAAIRNIWPTAQLLNQYAPELSCFLTGMENTRQIMAKVIGGTTAGLIGRVSIRGSLNPYSFPGDLPPYPSGTGPTCAGLPLLNSAQIPYAGRGSSQ